MVNQTFSYARVLPKLQNFKIYSSKFVGDIMQENSNLKRLLIFGGQFDPVHIEHMHIYQNNELFLVTSPLMEKHFTERIYLDQLCHHTGLSKSTLLRAFTKSKGITPYRYLETIRINKAKTLLENGVQPIEAAIQTGFSDQSHFTNYFNRFIGLSPGVYRNIFSDKNKKGNYLHF